MSINVYCVTNEQYARYGSAISSYIPFYQYSTLESFILALENNEVVFGNLSNSIKDAVKDQFNWLCEAYQNNSDCDYRLSGWTYGLRSCLNFFNLSQNDIDFWNNNLAGRTLEIILRCPVTVSGSDYFFEYYHFSKVLPTINSQSVVLVSDVCCAFSACNSAPFNRNMLSNWTEIKNAQQFQYSLSDSSVNNCDDLRTSTSTQECLITLNIESDTGESVSDSYNLLFQPDAQHTSGSVTNIDLYNFTSIRGVTCRFVGGVVRDSGIITIRGRIHGTLTKTPEQVSTGLVPVVEFFDEEVILFQGQFEPCCDTPVSWSETYTDVLGSLNDDDVLAIIGICEVTSIEWSGFGLLTDYCCDDSDCAEIDTSFPSNSLIVDGGESGGGESGGGESGGSGFDDCVCEWLESIDGRLNGINTNLSAIDNRLGGIKTAIESLDCICDKLDSLVSAINGLDLSVSNQITVTPSTAQITTPVNAPVTVNPAVNQVTVNPTPINNIVEPCSPIVTVNPTDLSGLISAINGLQLSASVTNNIDGLTCEDNFGNRESLACILKNALNYGGESISQINKKAFSKEDDCCDSEINLIDTLITHKDNSECENYKIAEIIKDKDCGSYVDCIVEPNELLSIRKTFKLDEDN